MIKTDFKFHLEDAEFLQYMGSEKTRKSIERILKSPKKRIDYDKAKEDLINLIEPKVGWNKFPVAQIKGEKLILKNGIAVGGGPVSSVIQGATEAIFGVCTIGPHVEDTVKDHMRSNQLTRGFFLDLMANWAVDSIRNQFYSSLKSQLQETKRYHTSIIMWPGEDWPLSDQTIIFDLLKDETEKIGVTLTPSLLMLPQKSVTFLFGIGPNTMGMEDGIQCQICSNNQTCPGYEVRLQWTQSPSA